MSIETYKHLLDLTALGFVRKSPYANFFQS